MAKGFAPKGLKIPQCLQVHGILDVVLVHWVVPLAHWIRKQGVELVMIKPLKGPPHVVQSFWESFFHQGSTNLRMPHLPSPADHTLV